MVSGGRVKVEQTRAISRELGWNRHNRRGIVVGQASDERWHMLHVVARFRYFFLVQS